jgi:drug/metabolite transporter (DMT)-like permease
MTLWVAVPVSVLGNFLNSVGYIIQKKGHNAVLLHPNEDGSVNSYAKSNTWRLGFLVYVIGSLLHGYALSQGSQSLITPLESVTLIANTFLCPLFLGERLRRIDIIGTVIILCGCTLAVVFGPTSDEDYTADDLIDLYIEPAFIILCCIVFFFFIIDYSGVRYVEKKCKQLGIAQDGSMKVYGAGFLCVSYSSIGALAGSYNVLFTKSVFEMLSLTFDGDNQLGVPWFWLLIVMFALGNVALEYWKQKALGIYGALYVVPIYQVIVIIGGIIVGGMYVCVLCVCMCCLLYHIIYASTYVKSSSSSSSLSSFLSSPLSFCPSQPCILKSLPAWTLLLLSCSVWPSSAQ